ncbi:unnamed protein product [Withania somnifera]
MSVDAEFSNGPVILIDEKLPEVGNSAVACENASSSGAVVLTKEASNFLTDMGQMEHNTASEITGTEEMSGEAGGSDKGNNDKKLSNRSAEAANAGNSGDKLQCDQSEETETADTDGGHGELSMVAKIKGINDEKLSSKSEEAANIGNSGDKLQCDQIEETETADTDGGHGELSMVAKIKGVNERGGAFNRDVNSVCEESADAEKIESNGQKAPSAEIKAIEELSGESNGSRKNDKCVDAEKGDINSSMAIVPVTETASMEERRGESSGPHRSNDDRRLSEESADTEKVESNGEREPSTVTKIKAVEEIRGESNGSSKNDKSMDDEKGDINSSMAINPVTETVGMEEMRGESGGPHRSNGTNMETTRMEPMECLSSFVQNSREDKSLSDQCENAGSEHSNGQSGPDLITKIKGINKIGGDSNCDVKLCEGSVDTEKVEINGHSAPSTFKEIEEIRSECNGSSKIDESVVAEKTGSNNTMATNTVTEISGLKGQSNAVEKIDIISEITVVDVKSNSAEEITNDKLGYQESTNIEKADSQCQKVSNIVSEIKRTEDIEDESDATNKGTDGNSTSEDIKDGELANGSTPVHKGEVICSTDAVTSGKESMNSLDDNIQNVCNRVFDTRCNEETESKFGSDNYIDDKVMHQRDENSERLHSDDLASEGMSSDAELKHDHSVLAAARLSEVDNSFTLISRDMSSNDAIALESEACTSCISHSQSSADMFQEILGKAVGGEPNNVDRSSDDKLMCKDFEDGKSFKCSSPSAEGMSCNAEFSQGLSTSVDSKFSEVGNYPTSSAKEVSSIDTVGVENEALNSAADYSQPLGSNLIRGGSGVENLEGELNGGDSSINMGILHKNCEDPEKSQNSSDNDGMSSNDEICHDQATLADLELFEAGNPSSSRDVSSYDAVTYKNEALTYPIEVDQELANMSIEISGTEETTGGLERSNDDKLICEQSGDAEISNTNEVLTSSSECSSVDVAAAKETNAIVAKGFYFLIRMPRFDDEKIREHIKVAESNVDEKTQHRDAIRQKIQNKRANCQTHGAEFEAVKAQERDARKQVRTKRADISTLQDMIDKAKNAVAVGEIDNRICNMEHIIGHETVSLKEEKLLIREIKQLKQLRGQLSSNIGNQDEVQKFLDERDANEEQLRALKKELDNLKVKVSKAETIAMAASRKFEDESRKLKELQAQFKAADDIRQEAYEELRNLKKDCMRRYMELWNKNDEFRKDYIRCNTRSTVRRFGTMDGRTLGPDEEPTFLPSYRVERVNRVVTSIDKVISVSQPPVSQKEKQVVVLKDKIKDDNIVLQAAEGMNQVEKTKEARKPIQRERIMVDEPKEAEELPTAQELEAARKEELRKSEEEARLKEQRRLEEIAKAKEALERKKRNAEKAQLRAELRAQKEEEQRLKEKEKRLRKKERKKGVGETQSGSNNGETAMISPSPRETLKEPEAAENSQTTTKKPSQYTKQLKNKSIPPRLWLTFYCVVVVALFFLGNIGFFSHLKPPKNPGP